MHYKNQENLPNRGIKPIFIMFDYLKEWIELRQSIVFDNPKKGLEYGICGIWGNILVKRLK